jgi:hypothetical protein
VSGGGSELALGDPFVALPPVIAGEVDEIPAQRDAAHSIVDLPVPLEDRRSRVRDGRRQQKRDRQGV